MASKREDQKEQSTRKMLDAALYEFANKGYLATKVSDIAERAGVTKGLVLARFGSKEELFSAVVLDDFTSYWSTHNKKANLYENLIKLLTDIKTSAKFKTTELLFVSEVVNSLSAPESCKKAFKDLFETSSLYRQIKNGIEKGVIGIHGDPFDVFFFFLKTAISLTVGYAEGNLEYLSNDEYLKILKFFPNNEIVDENEELVKTFSEAYDAIFLIDKKTEEIENLFVTEKYSSNIKRLTEEKNFYKRIEDGIVNNIFEEDKDYVKYMFSKKHIMSDLEQKDYFVVYFRIKGEEKPLYYQAKIANAPGDKRDTHFIMGIKESAEEGFNFRRSFETSAIVSSLAGDYDLVLYANIRTNEVTLYYVNDVFKKLLKRIDAKTDEETPNWKRIDTLFTEIVVKQDMKDFLASTDRTTVMENLQRNLSYSYKFRVMIDNQELFYKIKIAKDLENKNGLVIGLINIDEITRIELEKNAKEAALIRMENDQRGQLIDAFLQDVSTAYRMDLESGSCTVLKKSPLFMSLFQDNEETKIHYEMIMDRVIRERVIEEDRQMVFDVSREEYLKEALKENPEVSITFRDGGFNDIRYVTLSFKRLGKEKDFSQIVFGFTQNNEEIINEKASRLSLSDDRASFVVDIKSGKYRVLGGGTILKKKVPQCGYYDEIAGRLISRVDKDYLDIVTNVTSIENLKQFMGEEKIREVTYHTADSMYPWKRLAFKALDTIENKPSLVKVEFIVLDDVTAEQFDIRAQLNRVNIELLENKAFNEFFLEGYASAFYINIEDFSHTVFRINDAVRKMYDRFDNYYEGLTRYAKRFVAPEDRRPFLEFIDPKTVEERLKNKKSDAITIKEIRNGKVHYYTVQIMRGADSKHIALAFSDVDEIIKKERSQAQTEAAYQRAILTQAGGYCKANLSKNQVTQQFIEKNADDSFVTVLGGTFNSYDKMVREYGEKVIDPTDKARLVRFLSSKNLISLFAKGNTMPEIVALAYSAELGWHYAKFVTYLSKDDNSGDILSMTVAYNVNEEVKRKIKEREYAEKLADARQKAIEANEAKSRFLFNMSHDIRTPMNAIVGFTNRAKEHMDDKEELTNCLDKVTASNDYLLRLINDVLDMARIESGKLSIEEVPCDITRRIDSLQSMFDEQAVDRQIDFTVDMKNIQHKNVFMDPLRMRQIMSNVVSNALKYTKPGGRVSLTVTEGKSRKSGCAAYRFEISDTGIGMSEEFVEHIFEQFSREKSSTQSGVQGTGLGMAIVKQLVDVMEGKIKVESVLGEGTTIIINLNLRIADENQVTNYEESLLDKELPSIDKMKILLVEDNELNRDLAKSLLEEHGVRVTEAEDGAKAVEILSKARKGRFDVVLMDIQMPYMDGYEATSVIRNMKGFIKDIPIIAMTANAFEEDKRKALDIGMNGHITKPINSKELITTIFEVLEDKK